MASVHSDHFAVFIRYDAYYGGAGIDSAELPVAFCSTYAEARRLRRALQGSAAGDYVIRYEGVTGGGD